MLFLWLAELVQPWTVFFHLVGYLGVGAHSWVCGMGVIAGLLRVCVFAASEAG